MTHINNYKSIDQHILRRYHALDNSPIYDSIEIENVRYSAWLSFGMEERKLVVPNLQVRRESGASLGQPLEGIEAGRFYDMTSYGYKLSPELLGPLGATVIYRNRQGEQMFSLRKVSKRLWPGHSFFYSDFPNRKAAQAQWEVCTILYESVMQAMGIPDRISEAIEQADKARLEAVLREV